MSTGRRSSRTVLRATLFVVVLLVVSLSLHVGEARARLQAKKIPIKPISGHSPPLPRQSGTKQLGIDKLVDTDNDGIPDYLDPDDDNDGIPDDRDPDRNGDGILDSEQDQDGDGIPDYLDADDDGDGIADADEKIDTDGDGIPDDEDDDDDNDGIPGKARYVCERTTDATFLPIYEAERYLSSYPGRRRGRKRFSSQLNNSTRSPPYGGACWKRHAALFSNVADIIHSRNLKTPLTLHYT